MLVQFGNNCLNGLPNWTQSSEFFSSNYFQIGQHVVLLHIQINHPNQQARDIHKSSKELPTQLL